MVNTDQEDIAHLISLDRATTKSLYEQIEEQLSELIVSGRLPGGTILPPERLLATSLGISRGTVQQCYGKLRERGLMHGHGRHGSIVAQNAAPLVPPKERLRGFTEEVEALGQRPTTRVLEREILADRSIATLFQLPSESRFLRLVRLRLANKKPVSIESAWYSLAAVPELEGEDGVRSIYRRLAALGQPLSHCDQTIDAVSPSREEIDLFGFASSVPCLLIKRHSYLKDGQKVEYVEGVFRGDAYSYRMRLES